MKKALLLLSFVHLLAACTNDIEILPNDESQKLIVNALINANSYLFSFIRLSRTPSSKKWNYSPLY